MNKLSLNLNRKNGESCSAKLPNETEALLSFLGATIWTAKQLGKML